MIDSAARRLAIASLGPVLLALSACSIPKAPDLPVETKIERIVWLDQGWTEPERQEYHHKSQGTETIPVPYAWFAALERPEFSIRSAGLLSDPDYLARFGFIRGKVDLQHNPGGLPVGFARTPREGFEADPKRDKLGLTCAACHTAQINYKGTALLVDGGPALLDLTQFRIALATSVGLTEAMPFRFSRFAERVLGPDRTAEQEKQLKAGLGKFIEKAKEFKAIEASHGDANIEEGFGRLDALNRIGNEVFGAQLQRPGNNAPRTAPVAFPHIWDAGWFDWVQYNGSIEQPMVRNAGEAMGVRAMVNLTDASAPFRSALPVRNLDWMETLLMGSPPLADREFNGLRAPVWPGNILPPIDQALAARGGELYRENCQGCHFPPVKSEEFWRRPGTNEPASHWTTPNSAGWPYLRMPMIPVDRIGTDPAQAIDMANRKVTVPAHLGLKGGAATSGTDKIYGFADALSQVVEKVVNYQYDFGKPPVAEADRARTNGHRANGIRNGIPGPNGTERPAYKARPLDGIWATAPFLHNGSVPTLYDLLSPCGERPPTFYLGNREFDPVKVGYRSEQVPGAFLLDTTKRGNWNSGHIFDDWPSQKPRPPGFLGRRFSPDERAALVEFLKTL